MKKIIVAFIFCILLISCQNNDISEYEKIEKNCGLDEQSEEAPKEFLEKGEYYIICGKNKNKNQWIQYEYFIFDESKQLLDKEETLHEPNIVYDKLIVITNIAGTNVYQTKFINVNERKISELFSSPIAYNQNWVAIIDYKTSEIIAQKIFGKEKMTFPIDINIKASMGYPVDSYIDDNNILHINYQNTQGLKTEKKFILE